MAWFNSLVLSVVLISLSTQEPPSKEPDFPNAYERGEFLVKYREGVPEACAIFVADRVEAALRIVRAFLAQSENYEGPPYDTPLVVVIDPEKGPYQFRSQIHIPEQRALNALAEKVDTRIDLGIVHEITHVLAASFDRANRDRFYDDGLAVYLQHRFGCAPNYPDFGQDLYVATARAAKERGKLIPLRATEKTRRESKTRIGRKLAYLQEGAFTQYLIERFGIDAYFLIYHGGEIEDATGFTMDELEVSWVELMKATPVWPKTARK